MFNLNYKGLFLDNQSEETLLKGNTLPIIVENMHITFEFRPKVGFDRELLGKEFEVKVVGEGRDGYNHGYLVELPNEIIPYYKGADKAHITVSLGSKDCKPINTKNLFFNEIEPFYLKGKMGHFLGKDKIEFE